MEKLLDSEMGVSPMIGAFILVGLIVVMFVVVGVFVSFFEVELPQDLPMAKVGAVDAKGGLLEDTPVNYNENWIILSHTMGNPLDISRTKIQIKGYGETKNNTYGHSGDRGREEDEEESESRARGHSGDREAEEDEEESESETVGSSVRGNILVEYTNLGYAGKLKSKPTRNNDPYSEKYHGYEFHNPELSDGFWSAGEQVTLNGQDSINSGEASTVKVYMEGIRKTDNNWRFGKGKQITITVIDTSTNQVVSSIQTTMKSA